MKKKTYFITVVLLTFTMSLATTTSAKNDPSKGYKISLTISGGKDTVMYLGNYYAGNTYAIDTARINKHGSFVFEKKDRQLKPGLYFFTNPAGNYVEFMIYHETPNFSFTTNEKNWTYNMKVKGSKENEYLFRFQRFNHDAYNAVDSAMKAQGGMTDDFKAFRHKKLIELDSVKNAMIDERPNSMLALMMNATREPVVPRIDSLGNKLTDRQRWDYYMDHYFDYMRLDDDALVRTPDRVFHERIMRYLDTNLHNASAELICVYVDKLIDKAKPSKENFRYLVPTIAEKYLQSNVMSYDAVYVHIVKRYMETGDCFWMSPSTVDMNVKRANTWENLLIGKTAPELIMKDGDGNLHSLHNQQHKYTLLIFWSPSCGHCKSIIPALYRKYFQYKDRYDIGAFAVLSEPDEVNRPKWRDFIKSYNLEWLNIDGGEANIDWHEVYNVETTPQIFLLDKDKKIVAKRLNAETFELVINALENEK